MEEKKIICDKWDPCTILPKQVRKWKHEQNPYRKLHRPTTSPRHIRLNFWEGQFKCSAFHVETCNSHHHHLLSYTATALLRYLFKNPTISWFKQFFMNIVGVILIPSHHIYNLYRIISIINYNFGSNFIKIFEKTCALLMYLYFLNFFESELVV